MAIIAPAQSFFIGKDGGILINNELLNMPLPSPLVISLDLSCIPTVFVSSLPRTQYIAGMFNTENPPQPQFPI